MLEPTVNAVPVPARGPALPVVHAVTSDEIVARADFLDVACAVMAALGPRGALHLRAGRAHRGAAAGAGRRPRGGAGGHGRLARRERPRSISRSAAARAARSSRAARSGSPMRDAPRRRSRVGASVHSLDEARAAAEEGANWLVAGHVFATATHPGEEGRGLPFVRALAAAVDVPDRRDRRRAAGALRGAAPGGCVWARRDPGHLGRRECRTSRQRLSFGV